MRKLCKNSNRALTKLILKITLTILIFHEKHLRASFGIAWLREQLVRLGNIRGAKQVHQGGFFLYILEVVLWTKPSILTTK